MFKIKINATDTGRRADVFVAEKLPEFTRSSLSRLFEKSLVTANGKAIKASYKLHEGDSLGIEAKILTARPANIELPVIYEDSDVVVINKPAGVLTHSKGTLNLEGTVASFIWPRLNDSHLKGNRAGIVHRLDRFTSGVIITAKNERALKWLQKQFQARKATKNYFAIVEGVPETKQAIIDVPIERNPKKPQTFRVGSDGRSAQTQYKIIKVFSLPTPSLRWVGKSSNYSLLELKPLTGRTHQLRVHLKYIGHPIVGDRVYGHEGNHLYLHAASLELVLPNGQKARFEAKLPQIFNDFIKS